MTFADNYFVRYKALPPFFPLPTSVSLPSYKAPDMIVIIPCLDDECIFYTLSSLDAAAERANTGNLQKLIFSRPATEEKAEFTDVNEHFDEGAKRRKNNFSRFPTEKIEVIVNVNSGENAADETVSRNTQIYNKLTAARYQNITVLPILTKNIIRKKAGVGYARRIAMDEALRRFDAVGKPDGMIISLDADTLVSRDYFSVIAKLHSQQTDYKCFTFQFKHDFNPDVYPAEEINACRLYEIYLRYYRLALKTFDSPFAIHTIGSCFAVRAAAYAAIGGMPPRQAGEDFYFLQKAVKMQPVFQVREQIVFPSPRISNRVPFGTGPSVRHIIEKGYYKVYNFKLFGLLKSFYGQFAHFWSAAIPFDFNAVPPEIVNHIGKDELERTIIECRRYSATKEAFIKRMYANFDAFFIVKFLNTFNADSSFPPVDVIDAALTLLKYYGIDSTAADVYEQTVALDVL